MCNCVLLTLSGRDEAYTVEIEACGRRVNECGVAGVDDGAVGDVYVVYAVKSCQSACLDACLASATDDVVDVYVGEFRHIVGLGLVYFAGLDVGVGEIIGALKYDCLSAYIGHHDVGEIDILCASATADGTLETKTSVRTREPAIGRYDSGYAADVLAAYHESSVGVIDGVVSQQYVLNAIDISPLLMFATLEAETVIAGVDSRVDNETLVAVAQVDGIAILCVPGAAHGDTVHDDVAAVEWMHMKFRSILECYTLKENVLAIKYAKQVVASFLLLFRCFRHVGIA